MHRPQASAYSIWQTNTHVHIKKASKNSIKSTAVARNVYTMCTLLEQVCVSSLKIPPQKCFYGERNYASCHFTKNCNKYSKPINTSVIAGIIITRCDELRGMLVPACHYCCCFANVRNIVAACRYGTSVAGARQTYHQQLNRINYGLQ